MNKIKERKKVNAICPKCKSPDYSYQGRVYKIKGKHKFKCNNCGFTWTYGTTKSKYTDLA